VNVLLLQCTPEPERLVALAARLCYSPATICDLREEITRKDVRSLVRRAPELISFAGDTLHHSRLVPRVRSWINKEGSNA